MAGSQTSFPVLEGQRPVGVLSSAALIAALSRVGPEAAVGTVVARSGEVCAPGDPLDDVLIRLRGSGQDAIPVMNNDDVLVGLLTVENAGELLLVRNAIRRFHGDAKA